jgi:hypothetical protein
MEEFFILLACVIWWIAQLGIGLLIPLGIAALIWDIIKDGKSRKR